MKHWAFLTAICLPSIGMAADQFITLASTTSTQNSGLYDQILPKFTAATDIDVRVVAVGLDFERNVHAVKRVPLDAEGR